MPADIVIISIQEVINLKSKITVARIFVKLIFISREKVLCQLYTLHHCQRSHGRPPVPIYLRIFEEVFLIVLCGECISRKHV